MLIFGFIFLGFLMSILRGAGGQGEKSRAFRSGRSNQRKVVKKPRPLGLFMGEIMRIDNLA
jgi:hypothetical protein